MKGKTQFTRQEWKGFGIEDLRFSDFVESGDCYLQPVFNQKDGNLLFDALKIKNRERLEEVLDSMKVLGRNAIARSRPSSISSVQTSS